MRHLPKSLVRLPRSRPLTIPILNRQNWRGLAEVGVARKKFRAFYNLKPPQQNPVSATALGRGYLDLDFEASFAKHDRYFPFNFHEV